MTKKKFTVEIIQIVEVTLDDAVLNAEFNDAFSQVMWHVDELDDHATHIARMQASGLIGSDNFVEGYGDIKALGISSKIISQDEDVIEWEIKDEQ